MPGLKNLESLNLSFTGGIADSGLRTIATITSLTSLNLDSKQITDTGLAALTGKSDETHKNAVLEVSFLLVYLCSGTGSCMYLQSCN